MISFFFLSAWSLFLALLLHNSLTSSSIQSWSYSISNSSECISSSLPPYGLVHGERSESLTCLFLFGHSTDILALCFTFCWSECSADAHALDGPGCCGLSTDVLALLSAASSGSVYLGFPCYRTKHLSCEMEWEYQERFRAYDKNLTISVLADIQWLYQSGFHFKHRPNKYGLVRFITGKVGRYFSS